MKNSKSIFSLIVLILMTVVFAACSAGGDYDNDNEVYLNGGWNTGNEYSEISENPYVLTSEKPASSFAMDSNTAAYSNIRRYINKKKKIDKNMVRIEEMVNYFKYDYDTPTGSEALKINGAISPCPWNSEAKLLTVGVRAKDIDFSGVKNNIVFLMDISGSMERPDKLPLMQAAFKLLSENLNDDDYVSIVTYAGSDKIVLDGARGLQRKKIQNAIEDLNAGGGTAGALGIITAYNLAEKHFLAGENNRVILATDGDFNIGLSSQSSLENLITEKSSLGIDLTVLGFGYGNLKDNKLEAIAKCAAGGNYFYIDSILEARKVLVEEIGGTLVTVAKDVKAQVEFNPDKVYKYRLLGFENKLLTNDDFDNPKKPSGDIGAGHCVTAVYEIILKESGLHTSPLGDNFLKVTLRFKNPADNSACEILTYIDEITNSPNDDILFISSVVEAALVMRDSKYIGAASLQNVISRLTAIATYVYKDPYKMEFLELMRKLYDYS